MDGKLIIDGDFIARWAPAYDAIEDDEPRYQGLKEQVAQEIQRGETITTVTLKGILIWKKVLPRNQKRFDWQSPAYEATVRECLKASDSKRLALIAALPGIGVPGASTIVHFIYPDSFPIVDVRTSETLYVAGCIPKPQAGSLAQYSKFRSVMLKIRQTSGSRNLRELDRALFAYHKIEMGGLLSKAEPERRRDLANLREKYR